MRACAYHFDFVAYTHVRKPVFVRYHSGLEWFLFLRLITYFGNFVFGFLSLRLCDFLYNVFHLQGKMGKTKWNINKLLHNILVTSSPKTTKNKVTNMGWKAQICYEFFGSNTTSSIILLHSELPRSVKPVIEFLFWTIKIHPLNTNIAHTALHSVAYLWILFYPHNRAKTNVMSHCYVL